MDQRVPIHAGTRVTGTGQNLMIVDGSCRPLHIHMFPFRTESKELNDTTRRLTGGSFVQLPDGVTHYELGNSTRDQTVVLVHGFSVPYFIFDPTFHFLSQNGFR